MRMADHAPPDAPPADTPPSQPGLASALRFTTELVAWVATPWALWHTSIPLAIASVVVLIGLPTVFGTPGDKKQVMVAVGGWVTIGLVVLQLVAAAISAYAIWPLGVAIVVWVLAAACVVTEQPRWRWLAKGPATA
jgi:hypothetical protein